MAEKQTLSRPYAKAIFDMAVQDSDEQEWIERLELLSHIIADKTISELVEDPKSDDEKVIDLLFSLANDIAKKELDEKSKNLVKILVENKKITLIENITQMYSELMKTSQGKIEAEVTSAFAIDESQLKSITSALATKYNCDVTVNTKVDDSLIAGIIIRIGDEVIDGSVNTQLEKLAKTLVH